MVSKRTRSIVLFGIVLLPVLAAACTNSEELSSGVGPVAVRVQMVNTETRFGLARFDVRQITVRALDPDTEGTLGSGVLALLPGTEESTILVEYADGDVTFESETPLTVGRYILNSIDVNNLEFRNGTPGGTTCPYTILSFPPIPPPNDQISLTNFGQEVVRDVTLGANNVLTIVIDGAALVNAFQISWRCGLVNLPCTSAPLNQCTPRSFQALQFASQGPTFLSFP